MSNTKIGHVNIPIRLPGQIHEEVRRVAEKTNLSQQDTLRMAIERGLPLLEKVMSLSAEEIANIEAAGV